MYSISIGTLKKKKHSISNRNVGIAGIRNYMIYYTRNSLRVRVSITQKISYDYSFGLSQGPILR
jgi:hypothetical protein